MNKRYLFTEFYDLTVMFYGNVIAGSLLLWGLMVYVGSTMQGLTPLAALGTGLLIVVLHWDAAIWHQFGHASAARRTGYPMKGITAWWLLTASIYPSDEPELPAEVHIRRALGGPLASLAYTLLAGLFTWLFYASSVPAWRMLLMFWFLDNLIVFTIGSLLPLGFTDGSTLLHWWPRRARGDQS